MNSFEPTKSWRFHGWKSGAVVLFAMLLVQGVSAQQDLKKMRAINPNMQPPIQIDEDRVAANGIQKLESRYLVLYTDVRGRDDVNELPAIFDLAIEQLTEYFDVDPARLDGWQVSGFLMQEKEKFVRAGLFPNQLPDFPAGYNLGHHMWVYMQPGNYYTRHLLLHEGTHSFMQWFLGGSGPPWYSEGMAEMLAVHRWDNGKLQLKYRLKDRSEAEYWGRVKIIREDFAANNAISLENIFRMENSAFREVRNYAWAWAACKFFNEHPLSQAQFANLGSKARTTTSDFSREFFRDVKNDWSKLQSDWRLFITEMDYGIQIGQLNVTDATAEGDGKSFSIDATRGWQKTGIRVVKGQAYSVTASGRFQIANKEKPWPCEPGGVTIEYYRGQPLGKLMAGILGEDESLDGLVNQHPVGLSSTFTANRDGVLCFRVNESPSRLDDNSGTVRVQVVEN